MIAKLLLHCLFLESVRAYIVSNLYHANCKTTVSPLFRTRHGALKSDESALQMISGRFGRSPMETVDLIASNAVKSPSSRGGNKARVQMQSTRGHKSNIITLFCASPSRGFEDNTVEQAVEEQSVSSEVSTFISETTDTDSKLLHHHDPHAEQQSLIKNHLDIKVDTLTENIKPTQAEAEVVTGAGTAAAKMPVPHPMVITVMDSNAVPPPKKKKDSGFKAFFKGNWLVMGEVIVIYLAHLNPSFGATGGRLRPEFFISKLGVFTIFFINGIALSIGTYVLTQHQLQLQLECSCDWSDNDKSNSVILVCVALVRDKLDCVNLDRIVDYRTVSLLYCVVSCYAVLCYIL